MAADLRIVDVLDDAAFALVPPCADPRFDHRTCDYWEDADRGARDARPGWLTAPLPRLHRSVPRSASDNPFAPASDGRRSTPGCARGIARRTTRTSRQPRPGASRTTTLPGRPPTGTPSRPRPRRQSRSTAGQPRKLSLLTRGARVFGSYARVALDDDRPVAYAQFGPLSAYPRAQRLRELYPQLPSAPLPAVITCIATTPESRQLGHAQAIGGGRLRRARASAASPRWRCTRT